MKSYSATSRDGNVYVDEQGKTEVFSYFPEDGEGIVVNITHIYSDLHELISNKSELPDGWDFCTVPINQDFINQIKSDGSIEDEPLKRMMDKENPDNIPVIFLLTGESEGFLSDGRHRVMALHLKGVHSVRALVISEGHWDKYIMDGMLDGYTKEDILSAHSGRS